MWNSITNIIDIHLKQYPTTIEEDVSILEKDSKDHALEFNHRNCVMYRKGEKVILNYFKECALTFTRILKMTN